MANIIEYKIIMIIFHQLIDNHSNSRLKNSYKLIQLTLLIKLYIHVYVHS